MPLNINNLTAGTPVTFNAQTSVQRMVFDSSTVAFRIVNNTPGIVMVQEENSDGFICQVDPGATAFGLMQNAILVEAQYPGPVTVTPYTWIPVSSGNTNSWTAQNVFKAPSTTVPGFVAQASGTISGTVPVVDANAIGLFQGTEAVTSHVVWDGCAAPTHVYFRRANGTYLAKTAVANADVIGSMQWQGYGATTYGSTVQAQIRAVANQAFTDTTKGTDLQFSTTTTGAAVLTTALVLNASTATFTGQVIATGTASTAGAASFRSNGTISAIPTPSANIAAQFITAQASTGFIQIESSGAVNYLQFRRRNGTYAVPTAIANGDRLGTVSWAGQWGTTVGNLGSEDANFYAYATEAFTSTARGTGIGFEVQTIGTTTKVTALNLTAATATFAVPVISTGNLRIVSPSVPAAANSAGTAGDIAWANGFLYICVAASTWQRVAIATWP